MADLVERLIELITGTLPLEENISGVVAGMIEKTASRLARFEPTARNGETLME
jgi:hypothetical protein